MKTPTILAHRGGRDEAGENCVESFADALSRGIPGAETDLRLTKDGEIVLMHDATVDRTTTSSGRIADMTLAEVKELSLRKTGQRVPTFAEFCEVYRGVPNLDIEIELKLNAADEPAESMDYYLRRAYETAASTLVPGVFMFTSGSAATLRRMRSLFPEARLAFISDRNSEEVILVASLLGCVRLNTRWDHSTARGVDLTHQAGMEANLWCADTPEVYRLISLMGADATASNRPRELIARSGGGSNGP